MANIVQWNCRGLRANYNDLLLLLSNVEPVACCLQELLIDDNYTLGNRQYNLFSTLPPQSSNRPTGGVGILVRKATPHSQLTVNTPLQAVACRISIHRPITVCSVYLPPNSSWAQADLQALVAQLPGPVLLLGDFNAHHTLWGCSSTDSKGKEIADFLLSSNLCLCNDKRSTYIHPATGSRSTLDLAMCDPALYLDFDFSVYADSCGSDHFPVILKASTTSPVSEAQRWKLHRADWSAFGVMCANELRYEEVSENSDPVESFVKRLIQVANKTVPKTSDHPRKISKPWFNDECRAAIRERKEALRRLAASPTQTNLNGFRVLRAKARRVIRAAKRDSWRDYVSKLNSQTPLRKVWKMVRRISGKPSPIALNHLKVNNATIEAPQDIANTIGSTLSYNSSTAHYTDTFRRYKAKHEKRQLAFQSDNSEPYNNCFSMSELTDALRKAHDSAAGPDQVHYQFLKHLPTESREALLRIFNDVWLSGDFPTSWREATVIPIPKPGKDATDPGNYRPIALTSCLCKTFERMVNERLVWFLERNGILTEVQSGFRKQRSTTDQLLRLETFIREAFVRREHVVAVFFDLEKAYDTTWRYGILRDLHDANLRGRLPQFVSKFLSDRRFRVRVGSCLSDAFPQEMGVPQGSILSVTLFILKINSIVQCLPPSVRCSLYVDDFLICYRSRNMRSIERLLQRCMISIQTWADENGFQFSKTKTVCMHFCQQHTLHREPELTLYGVGIPVVDEVKFLGLIFDRRLSFAPHIHYLKQRCMKALNLLRVVAHADWGADSATLFRLYRSHVRSKLDYGCVVYGSARAWQLQTLDRVQNAALRTCLGAFRTSPYRACTSRPERCR
jgi:hypothetical protein